MTVLPGMFKEIEFMCFEDLKDMPYSYDKEVFLAIVELDRDYDASLDRVVPYVKVELIFDNGIRVVQNSTFDSDEDAVKWAREVYGWAKERFNWVVRSGDERLWKLTSTSSGRS